MPEEVYRRNKVYDILVQHLLLLVLRVHVIADRHIESSLCGVKVRIRILQFLGVLLVPVRIDLFNQPQQILKGHLLLSVLLRVLQLSH